MHVFWYLPKNKSLLCLANLHQYIYCNVSIQATLDLWYPYFIRVQSFHYIFLVQSHLHLLSSVNHSVHIQRVVHNVIVKRYKLISAREPVDLSKRWEIIIKGWWVTPRNCHQQFKEMNSEPFSRCFFMHWEFTSLFFHRMKLVTVGITRKNYIIPLHWFKMKWDSF